MRLSYTSLQNPENSLENGFMAVFYAFTILFSVWASDDCKIAEGAKIGQVLEIQGRPQAAQKNQSPRALTGDSDVLFGQIIRTDSLSSVKIKSIDGSEFTVGPNSVVEVDRYVFDNCADKKWSYSKGAMRKAAGFLGTSQRELKEVSYEATKSPAGSVR